ncbi:phosphoenolpyruvate carboxylase [Mycolicibacterium fortuitum]|nr:phosphoenolpyruvate carboxylase [Mycolicibacterium fortuitum]NOP99551.1 phosphoenolpyruvate carboxylase [Mycolicibacterium fortuitum]
MVELGVDEMTAVIDLVRAGLAVGRGAGPAARALMSQAAARNL